MGSHTITVELSLSQLCWKSFPSSLLAFNLNSEHSSTSTRILLALSRTHSTCTVKKGLPFSRPQPGCHWPNSPWREIIISFASRESLVTFLQFTGPLANLPPAGWYAELGTDAGKVSDSQQQPGTVYNHQHRHPTTTTIRQHLTTNSDNE